MNMPRIWRMLIVMLASRQHSDNNGNMHTHTIRICVTHERENLLRLSNNWTRRKCQALWITSCFPYSCGLCELCELYELRVISDKQDVEMKWMQIGLPFCKRTRYLLLFTLSMQFCWDSFCSSYSPFGGGDTIYAWTNKVDAIMRNIWISIALAERKKNNIVVDTLFEGRHFVWEIHCPPHFLIFFFFTLQNMSMPVDIGL